MDDEGSHWFEGKSGPSVEHRGRAEGEASVALVSAQAGKFHAPVESACTSGYISRKQEAIESRRPTKEGKHDRSIRDLDSKRLVEYGQGDARVDIGENACCSQACLVREIDGGS